ncbi:MAG: metal ABC transporter permease [Cyanobacteria bacterium P01_H01_bin.15]
MSIVLAAILGRLSALLGIIFSAGFDSPSGPTVVVTQFGILIFALLIPAITKTKLAKSS